MKAIYAFGLLILLAFLGSRFIVRRKSLSPLRYIFLSGLVYIFLGMYLGKMGLNILSSEVLDDLTPLLSLGLGWIGFLFGFQFERKYLRRFSKKYIGLSFLESSLVFLFVSVAIFFIVRQVYHEQPRYSLYGMALAFGLLATVNSPTLLNVASFALPRKGDYCYLARFLTSISGFWAILGLALLFSFWHFPFFDSRIILKGSGLFASSTLIPIILGYLFHLLTKKRAQEQDIRVYLLGFVFFISGAAFYFNLPPLYVSMVMGIAYSNLTKIQERLYPLLLPLEKPLYIVFLILIGAIWEFKFNTRIALLIGVFLSSRFLGYVLPLRAFKFLLRFPFPLPHLFGFTFLSFGGIGIAFAVSLKLAYAMELTEVFISVALISIIVSDFISPWLLKVSLLKLDCKDIS
ncbi:MAG: hypothetical protein PVH84_11995 [Candidatus Aminicenantes bacterium]|jgi:hypothetical protein